MNIAERKKSGEEKKPTMMIKADAKSPFAMPASTSPVIMEEGLMGACTKIWNVLK